MDLGARGKEKWVTLRLQGRKCYSENLSVKSVAFGGRLPCSPGGFTRQFLGAFSRDGKLGTVTWVWQGQDAAVVERG